MFSTWPVRHKFAQRLISFRMQCMFLAELANGPTGCGEVARGGCLFGWNFNVTGSTVLTNAERRH